MPSRRSRIRAFDFPSITCPSCRGDGVTIGWSGSSYDSDMGAYYPREEYVTCGDCRGGGEALCDECDMIAVHEDPSTEHVFYCIACCPPGVRALNRLLCGSSSAPSLDQTANTQEWPL